MTTLNINESLNDAVIEFAKTFAGHFETKSNAQWDSNGENEAGDAEISKAIKVILSKSEIGWKTGQPYCAAWLRAIHWQVAHQFQIPNFEKSLWWKATSNLCLYWFNKANAAGLLIDEPVVGAVGIMQMGNTAFGHAFLVIGVDGDTITTIEANTSAPKSSANPNSDREGDGIYKKTRYLSKHDKNKLHLVGFVRPFAAGYNEC